MSERPLQRRDGLERAVERDAFFVEQGGIAQPPHPLGAVGARASTGTAPITRSNFDLPRAWVSE